MVVARVGVGVCWLFVIGRFLVVVVWCWLLVAYFLLLIVGCCWLFCFCFVVVAGSGGRDRSCS